MLVLYRPTGLEGAIRHSLQLPSRLFWGVLCGRAGQKFERRTVSGAPTESLCGNVQLLDPGIDLASEISDEIVCSRREMINWCGIKS
jgi:hypothetical protein